MKTYHPAYPQYPSTFGPAFDGQLDGQRVRTQLQAIADLMEEAYQKYEWLTLQEIEERTGYPQASISAQLRHLKKPQFGGHNVLKRRREFGGEERGTWEYLVAPANTKNKEEL